MTTSRQLAKPNSAARPAGATLQRACACGKHTAAGGECAECAQKREQGLLQRAAIAAAPAPDVAPPIVHDVLRTPGQPLDEQTRAFVEPRFGQDFGDVRVHTDAQAAESARSVGALAYTVGNHVAFGAGQYQPSSSTGQRLLAHELAHVVLASPVARSEPAASTLLITAETSPGEHAARALAQGQAPTAMPGEAPAIRREAMTQEQINKRLEELNVVMNDLRFSAAERKAAAEEFGQLSALLKNTSAANSPSNVTAVAPTKAAPTGAALNISPSASVEEIIEVMRVIDAIKPSELAGGLFTTRFKGQTITLTTQQAEQVRAGARKALKDALDKSISRRNQALGRYQGQEKVNDDFPVTSRAVKAFAWIRSLGSYSNPRESVYGQSAIVNDRAARAKAAIEKGSFAEAIRLVSEADAASERTSIIVHAYIDQLIEGGENLATGLTYTRDAAFITVGVLAVVITGGAALGLEAGVVGTGVGGLSLGTTTTVVSVGAPIVANLGVAGLKVAEGDKVDWGQLVVETVVQIVLAKFGGKLSAGIAGKLAGNPATQTLARQAIATLVSGAATHVVSQAFSTTVSDVYQQLHGKNVTWDDYLKHLADALSEPTGWFMVALGSGVHTAAQAKVANAVKSQAAATPPQPAATADKPATTDVGLADRGYRPQPGERATTREQWKAQSGQERWKRSVEKAFEGALENQAATPNVTGGKTNQRIGDRRVPPEPKTRMDIEDVPLRPGETSRQAVARVRTVIGKKVSDLPELSRHWDAARAEVLRSNTLTDANKTILYDKTRDAFWRNVRRDPAATKILTDAGFVLPSRNTTAPVLGGVDPSIPEQETRISLDHIAEKAQGDNWRKALDADNLRLEFAQPNTEREVKQARHPNLRED